MTKLEIQTMKLLTNYLLTSNQEYFYELFRIAVNVSKKEFNECRSKFPFIPIEYEDYFSIIYQTLNETVDELKDHIENSYKFLTYFLRRIKLNFLNYATKFTRVNHIALNYSDFCLSFDGFNEHALNINHLNEIEDNQDQNSLIEKILQTTQTHKTKEIFEYKIQGYTYQEIADILNLSIAVVKSRYWNHINWLKKNKVRLFFND